MTYNIAEENQRVACSSAKEVLMRLRPVTCPEALPKWASIQGGSGLVQLPCPSYEPVSPVVVGWDGALWDLKGQGNRLWLGSLQRSVDLFGPVPGMTGVFPGLPVRDYLQIPHTTQGCREIQWFRRCGNTVKSLHYSGKGARPPPPTQVTGVSASACSEL